MWEHRSRWNHLRHSHSQHNCPKIQQHPSLLNLSLFLLQLLAPHSPPSATWLLSLTFLLSLTLFNNHTLHSNSSAERGLFLHGSLCLSHRSQPGHLKSYWPPSCAVSCKVTIQSPATPTPGRWPRSGEHFELWFCNNRGNRWHSRGIYKALGK